MKKAIPLCLLALCLLVGCAGVHTTGTVPSPAASVAATPSASAPAAAPSAATVPSPSASAAPSPMTPDEASAVMAVPSGLTDKLDQIFAARPEFYGSVLIARDGHLLLCKGYGRADAARGLADTPETKFLVGSVTKQFTSMAILQLYEQGRLDIHDSLSKYLTGFTRGKDITLIQLLTQTSGIADYMNDAPSILASIPYKSLSEQSIVDQVKTRPLKFEPGTNYSYSNTNYLILGMIVAKVSGTSYGRYLTDSILKPLGMENTGVFDLENPPENMASGYWSFDKPFSYFTPEGDINPENARATATGYGAGCLYSTVGDLYLWDQALLTEKLLSKKYMDMLFAPSVHVPNPAQDWSYGYGWVIENDPTVGKVWRHTGNLGGFQAYNGLYTDLGATVIVLYNNTDFKGIDTLIPAVKLALKAG